MSKLDKVEATVLRLEDFNQTELINLLKRYQLEVQIVLSGQAIPGSFWGDAEARLIGRQLFLWQDTPLN